MNFYYTINKIKRWNRSKNVERLIASLNSKDSEIRKSAALCLGEIGDRAAIESLVFVVDNDKDFFVRKDASRALNQLELSNYDSRHGEVNIETTPELVVITSSRA